MAELAGVPEHALWAALGITIDRGEDHTELFRHLGIERPPAIDHVVVYDLIDLYPDAAEAGFPAGEVAYVGDRLDNDVEPAVVCGLVSVWIRRGPWGWLQRGGDRAAARIESLAELPEALLRLPA